MKLNINSILEKTERCVKLFPNLWKAFSCVLKAWYKGSRMWKNSGKFSVQTVDLVSRFY